MIVAHSSSQATKRRRSRNALEGLAALLKNCRQFKVVRLCVLWSEELNLPWATAARKVARKRLGHGRWTARLKDGTLLILKP